MASWMEKNKSFVFTFLGSFAIVVSAFAVMQVRCADLEEVTRETKADLKTECVRSQEVDAAILPRFAKIETSMDWMQKDIERIQVGQKEALEKLDWLIQRQVRDTRGD